jgi:signal transduction histidine kinase
MAHRIAAPIIQLARFTREFMLDPKTAPPLIKASGEIAELNEQFMLMVSNLEQSQQDRVRMAKFAVIAEMAATMAHEIRTPLGILRSSAQILRREKNLSPIAAEMIGFISSETTRLNQLVSSLLESSRPRETRKKAK